MSSVELTENDAYTTSILPPPHMYNICTIKGHIPSFRAIFMELELVTWQKKKQHVKSSHCDPVVGLQKAMSWTTKWDKFCTMICGDVIWYDMTQMYVEILLGLS